MRVEENANYTAFLSPIDIENLISNKPITFWVIIEGIERTFKLRKE